MLTPYQAQAYITKTTGRTFRLPLGHELVKWEFSDDLIQAVVLTARVRSQRGGLLVTHRGMVGYQFFRHPGGSWEPAEPVRLEWKLDEPVLMASYQPKAAIDQQASVMWARLCHRPGNKINPMDGPGGSNPSVW